VAFLRETRVNSDSTRRFSRGLIIAPLEVWRVGWEYSLMLVVMDGCCDRDGGSWCVIKYLLLLEEG
jgi:hypothetical protein